MKRLCIMLIALAVPLAAGAAMSPEETVLEAERAEKNGSFQQAVELYGRFLKEFPDHIQRPTALYRLALCYDSMGKTDLAIDNLKQALAVPPEKATGKHRPDAYMKLARLLADASRHQEAADALDSMLKEGAGLYEDEAQSLRASYLALLGRYEEAVVLFNVLRAKPSSEFAKEAGYKLAIVWFKADETNAVKNALDMAKNAIEEFIQRYPGDQRIGELFVRAAKAYFLKQQYKSAAEVCQQVLTEHKDAPEAIEAAFIVALCYRDNGNFQKAIEAFDSAARMPQAAHNTILASEAMFEAAQIYRRQLKEPEKASEYYREAAIKSRDPLTERQQTILEQSLFYEAEYCFEKQKWAAAFDLYAQLRKMGSKLNVIERMMFCKSKMSSSGDVSMDIESEEELEFIRKRISDNPQSLLALQSEVFLLERRFDRTIRYSQAGRMPPWSSIEPFVNDYGALLRKYPEAVLKQQYQGSYVKMRMASMYTYVAEDDPNRLELSQRGLALYEEVMSEAPEALFRVEALEGLAMLANRSGQNRKAFDAYRKLYDITGIDPQSAVRRPPSDYLQGLVATADSVTMADEAIKTMEDVVANKPATNSEAREARFLLAELYYMKQRYAGAAAKYQEFVKLYGPPQDDKGAVSGAWQKPGSVDRLLDQVYEAAQRVAHCWRTQGSHSNMVAAYRWVSDNLNHMNPRVAEARYMALTAGVDLAKLTPAKKEDLARNLWSQVVNSSTDFGSKAFKGGYHPWVGDSRAVPYVKAAILKSGQLHGDVGKHKVAGDIFREYTRLFDPDEKRTDAMGRPLYQRDDQYETAVYASGKEYLIATDYESMARAFREFLDTMRESRFRVPALMALGHYGVQAEMFQDGLSAYSVLLDEYGPPNPVDSAGRPVPVPKDKWFRKESLWNGIRRPAPAKWDVGKVRYGLGFLYWRKEDWANCHAVLLPFLDDPVLKASPSRGEALFMAARSMMRMHNPTNALKLLETIAKENPDLKAIEEVYCDIAKVALEIGNWQTASSYAKQFLDKYPNSDRRAYIELHAAVALAVSGNTEAGERQLRVLSKADTYEDVKAGAYYQLAMMALKQGKPGANAEALGLLRKSLAAYTEAPALMQAARCALEGKEWTSAREYLDRFVVEFPKSDKVLLEEVQQLRRRIVQEEAKLKR
jgi:tetratricopeptide (TPR) repeat protein